MCACDCESHSRMVLSELPLASVPPSGLNATLVDRRRMPFESVQPERACEGIPQADGIVRTSAAGKRSRHPD